MNLILAIVLAASALAAWWLSAYDTHVTGENLGADFTRRITRVGITVFVMGVATAGILSRNRFGGFTAIGLIVPLALYWSGCGSEFAAHSFHALIDSSSQKGRHEEALELCTRLAKSGEVSALAMETMLFRIYDGLLSDERLLANPALAVARTLIAAGQFEEAEAKLRLRWKREPADLPAGLVLIRLCATDLRSPGVAQLLIKNCENRPSLPPYFAAYARHRLQMWTAPRKVNDEGIESLLAGNPACGRQQ